MSTRTEPRREELIAQREFLLASIRDLEREHAAGDLDDGDFDQLRSDYVRRAAACIRDLEALGPATEEDRPSGPLGGWRRLRRRLGRRRTRRALALGSGLCLLAAAGLFAAHLAGVRLPGQSATGTITISQAAVVAQELTEASVDANADQLPQAELLYDEVLAKVPDQPEALTYGAWLGRLAGVEDHDQQAVRSSDARLAKAVSIDPGYPDAEGLYGVALAEDDHEVGRAVKAFDTMLKDRPSTTLLTAVAPAARAAYVADHQKVPAALAS